MNQLQSKLALVIGFKNFLKGNPKFFSQVGKEINPLRCITLEFWNVIDVWRKDRFTLHDFQKGGCIADQRRNLKGMQMKWQQMLECKKGATHRILFGRFREYKNVQPTLFYLAVLGHIKCGTLLIFFGRSRAYKNEVPSLFYLAVLGHIKMCYPPYFIWPFLGI